MSRTKIVEGAAAQAEAPLTGVADVRARMQAAMKQLTETFVDRTDAVDCIFTAMVAGTNFLLVGDPGTAKTALVKAAYAHVQGARVFSTLCGAFATEDKIFGPLDLGAYKENKYQRVLKGRLGDCDLAFLDEMFKSNEGCLNGMLTALNERVYEQAEIPLVCCGAASNWPEVNSRTKTTAAIWDRLVLRCPVSKVAAVEGNQKADPKRIAAARAGMLRQADKVRSYRPTAFFTLDELAAARAEAAALPVDDKIVEMLVDMVGRLENDKVVISDRRLAQMQDMLRAHAWLTADPKDAPKVGIDAFDALRFGLWESREQWLTVQVVISTVDEATVKTAIQKLQQATRQAQSCTSAAQAPHALRQAADASEEVRDLIKKQGVRKSSFDRRIKPEVAKLQAEYVRLNQQVGERLPTKGAPGAAP